MDLIQTSIKHRCYTQNIHIMYIACVEIMWIKRWYNAIVCRHFVVLKSVHLNVFESTYLCDDDAWKQVPLSLQSIRCQSIWFGRFVNASGGQALHLANSNNFRSDTDEQYTASTNRVNISFVVLFNDPSVNGSGIEFANTMLCINVCMSHIRNYKILFIYCIVIIHVCFCSLSKCNEYVVNRIHPAGIFVLIHIWGFSPRTQFNFTCACAEVFIYIPKPKPIHCDFGKRKTITPTIVYTSM